MPMLRTILICLVLLCICVAKPTRHRRKEIGDVVERGLVRDNINYRSILKEHKKHSSDTKTQKLSVPVLGYVTPWNSHGYDIAKKFNTKFNYIAPVWYQIKYHPNRGIFLTGSHDVDQSWIEEVRYIPNSNSSSTVNIVPRFIFEGWSFENYQRLINGEELARELVSTLVRECIRQRFDGLVLEHGYVLNNEIAPLLISLANQLHEVGKKIILVLPAEKGFRESSQHTISPDFFVWFTEYIDHFSLMTYDFSSPQRPGPTSPLSWVTQNILRLLPPGHRNTNSELGKKILVGLNFYGYEYWDNKGEAVIGSSYVRTLASYKPTITWDSAHHEHVFTYNKDGTKHTVYYPSLKSLQDRLSLVEDLGVGLSIWEIGQGLDYFLDLF